MVTQPAYLRALRDYTKTKYGDDATTGTVAHFMTESDRGALILAATNIEDSLELQILERLPALILDEAARKEMFEQDGAISSFSRKTAMAYAMGIIDKPYRKLIDLIREVRNACAHSRQDISLEVPELRKVCEVVIADMLPDMIDRSSKNVRAAFVSKCAFVAIYIATGQKIEGSEAQIRYHANLVDEQDG